MFNRLFVIFLLALTFAAAGTPVVRRLAYRLGFSSQQHPDKVELDMQALLPPERWMNGHQLLVWHGRRTCFARSPACERWGVADLCPKKGVRVKTAPPSAAPRQASVLRTTGLPARSSMWRISAKSGTSSIKLPRS